MTKFIVPSLVDLLESGKTPRVLPFVLASWLYYLRGRDENGRQMTISDPLIGALHSFLEAGGSDAGLALSTRSLFGDLASTHPRLVTQVQSSLDALRSHGVRAAIEQTIEQVQVA
jgi:mannitol-1-phosphate/altronate dehydrogenase